MLYRPSHALALLVLTIGCSAAQGKEVDASVRLESQLLAQVEQLVSQLQEAGVENIGVLKFAVRNRFQQEFPGNKGYLNRRLTEKTEVALALAKTNGKQEIRLIANATDIASQIPGATHLRDVESRDRLFTRNYPLAWQMENGSKEARPDAFLFGVAEISDDLRKMTISLSAFLREDLRNGLRHESEFISTGDFQVDIDIDDLLASGEGYALNSRGESNRREQVFKNALKGRQGARQKHPFKSPDRPLELEILYDGRPQKLLYFNTGEVNDPGAYLREPTPEQKVEFRIKRRNSNDRNRYGILLRVNGTNTLLKQRLPDNRCALWVSEPEQPMILVSGFQLSTGTNGKRLPFTVLGAKESLDLLSFYGSDLGLISMTVFAEADEVELRETDVEESRDLRLHTIKKSTIPKKTAANRSMFGKSLTDQILAQTSTRGAISVDEDVAPEKSATRDVKFRRATIPVFAASVRYYKPTKVRTR